MVLKHVFEDTTHQVLCMARFGEAQLGEGVARYNKGSASSQHRQEPTS
jgi:hypothetical protein